MRKLSLVLLAAALPGGPAMAQLGGVGVNVGVDANAGVNAGQVLDGVGRTVDRTVNAADRTVNRAADRLEGDLVLATRADVRGGLAVRDSRGQRIGTVQEVHGDSALVVQGSRSYHVPLASLYRSSRGLVTNLSRADLRASANVNAGANASGSANR